MTLTTTPAVKATNGLPPVGANSRSRVVNPILRKQKVNAQLRSAVIGATRAGLTILLKSPYEALPTAQVTRMDAIRKPTTKVQAEVLSQGGYLLTLSSYIALAIPSTDSSSRGISEVPLPSARKSRTSTGSRANVRM